MISIYYAEYFFQIWNTYLFALKIKVTDSEISEVIVTHSNIILPVQQGMLAKDCVESISPLTIRIHHKERIYQALSLTSFCIHPRGVRVTIASRTIVAKGNNFLARICKSQVEKQVLTSHNFKNIVVTYTDHYQ